MASLTTESRRLLEALDDFVEAVIRRSRRRLNSPRSTCLGEVPPLDDATAAASHGLIRTREPLRSDADSCATSRAHIIGSRENVCPSHGTPPAVMQTSRFVNGHGLLICKRKHVSGLAKFFCFGFPSTRHKSIIRIQNAAGCSQSKGENMRVGRRLHQVAPSVGRLRPTTSATTCSVVFDEWRHCPNS